MEQNTPRGTKEILENIAEQAHMAGRILAMREMGKFTFIKLRDRTGDFQICLAKNAFEDEDFAFWNQNLDLGDIVGFLGEFFFTKHGEPSLMVKEITPLSKSLRPLPEKFHGLTNKESIYRQRYLDTATNLDSYARFVARSKVITAIRAFLDTKDFLEVETRTLQPQAGGAMAKVFRTHHEALDSEMVLRISLELDLKMLTVGGYERVYEIGKCFRNEGIDPSHLQEFTLLEWYAAYADLADNMAWTQEMLKNVTQKVFGTTKFEVLDKENKKVEVDFAGEWPRVRFGDLLETHAGIHMQTDSLETIKNKAKELGMKPHELETTSRGNLLDFIYKKTARPGLIQPTFVLDYPSDLKPLARPKEDGTAECYQLLVAGWEIVNSYGELVDPTIQRKILEKQAASKAAGDDEAMEVDESFITAMEHAMPPQTGFGMGIDRLVALLTGQENLKDVVFFPMMKQK